MILDKPSLIFYLILETIIFPKKFNSFDLPKLLDLKHDHMLCIET
jgi:hypothetical protein